jgi:hypothetical protein
MDFKEDVDWIHLAQDRAAVNTCMWRRQLSNFSLPNTIARHTGAYCVRAMGIAD